MFDHQIKLVLAHYLIVSYYPCVASLSCRRRTRATRCVTPIPFYTKVDAQCDKLATVKLSWQRLRRSMCSGKIVQLRGKVLQYWIHCHFELPATSYRRICLLLSATLKIFIMLNDIKPWILSFSFCRSLEQWRQSWNRLKAMHSQKKPNKIKYTLCIPVKFALQLELNILPNAHSHMRWQMPGG